ncbi:hypothetical protein L1987_34768 [Smallanthus sonchifolius]|uniref:Uncharacterized protein n=1 Tax=Smallanthus sonchifolius TaxID=185202 RepID=A0ACB9HUR6_9ASTR|nr:hypothetical protein L1987_34768 [Smallanthus sonchifolius]
MKTESIRHLKGASWPKMKMRKWLNLKKAADGFHSDFSVNVVPDRSERRKSCSDDGRYAVVPEELSEEWLTNDDSGRSKQEKVDLRFQEIVPLNAGNVLGAENKSPAVKWLSLIHEALNTNPQLPLNYNPTSPVDHHQSTLKPRASFSDLLSLENELGHEEFQRIFNTNFGGLNDDNYPLSGISDPEAKRNPGFSLVASKQMVGIFLCIFIREDLRHYVSDLKVSCVGRGIMGYLGNKIIWLGDLNYRLSSTFDDLHEIIQRNDWQALLEKDQLKIEQKAGRIFEGWEEGKIWFAPTYKYITNSDRYVAQTCTPKEKRRTPAWCDRILWKGEGLKQISYVRVWDIGAIRLGYGLRGTMVNLHRWHGYGEENDKRVKM